MLCAFDGPCASPGPRLLSPRRTSERPLALRRGYGEHGAFGYERYSSTYSKKV
jgi:hypothetical protein